MKRLLIILFIILLINSYISYSQDTMIVDNWTDLIDEFEDINEDQWESFFSALSFLSEHPVDLNNPDKEELEKLFFLSEQQIESLLEYSSRYGPFVSIYELQHIPGLDMLTIRRLIPFVNISSQSVENRKITVNNIVKYSSNELVIRYDRGFQQKKGYAEYPDTVLSQYPNRKYLGEPFYNSVRFSSVYQDKIQLGMVMEKDAGEPFMKEKHKGYDFYSAHLFLKDISMFKSIVVGDYKASFGQGLVFSQDYTPGKTVLITQPDKRTNGFRRHYSTNEIDFLRGFATTIRMQYLDLNLFYSERSFDGIVDQDRIFSIKTDGLRRLERDWEKKNALRMRVAGGNIRWAKPDYHLGMTALVYDYKGKEMDPDEKPYNVHYFRDKKNLNLSMDYMIKNRYVRFFGETAISKNGAVSSLNGIKINPVSYFHTILLYRYYDKKYHAWFGNAFGQQSRVQNEQGLYGGIVFTPYPYWKISSYIDYFRFPWLKYGVDAPSTGKEYLIQLDYTPRPDTHFYLRYRSKQAEKNGYDESGQRVILPYQQNRYRAQAQYRWHELAFKSIADYNTYTFDDKTTNGILFSQSIGWDPSRMPVRADMFIGKFITDDYSTRIYTNEKNLLYMYGMSSHYGDGMKIGGVIRWNPVRAFVASMKFTWVKYNDRETIGTGTEEIEGNKKADISFQMQFKF